LHVQEKPLTQLFKEEIWILFTVAVTPDVTSCNGIKKLITVSVNCPWKMAMESGKIPKEVAVGFESNDGLGVQVPHVWDEGHTCEKSSVLNKIDAHSNKVFFINLF